MSVYGKFFYAGDNLEDVFEVRRNTFQKEMDRSEMELSDQFDNISIHVVIYTSGKSNKVVSCGRLLLDDNKYYIDRVDVINEENNNGYEDLVVRMLANKAFNLGSDLIFTDVKLQDVPFYQSIGFQLIHDNLSETGCRCIPMKLVSSDFYKECK